MSRRISLQCTITNPDILDDTLDELGIPFHKPGPNVYRFHSSQDGISLLYGGLTLIKPEAEKHFEARFDEDCSKSKETMHLILQNYMKNYYLWQATLQGDQIVSCYIADGIEKDPLISPGDIVIHAVKG